MRLEALAGRRRRRKLDLSSDYDTALLRLFVLSLLVCVVASVITLVAGLVESFVLTMPIISFALVVVGLVSFADRFRWYYALLLLAVVAALYVYGAPLILILFIVYAVLGGFGVVAVIVTLQRRMFYRTLARIEGISLREELDPKDKILMFIFNIPDDLNTADLVMEHNMSRDHVPLDETLRTMGLGFFLGIALWIFISLNPSLVQAYPLEYILLLMFLITLYIPFMVLPWSIFRSLDVRIKGPYQDMRLYKGAVATFKKIAMPIIPISLYTVGAARMMGLETLAGFIGMAVLFNIAIMASTSIVYFALYERDLIEDVVSRWRDFRPTPLLVEVMQQEGEEVKKVPATPQRRYELDDLPEVNQIR